MGIEQGEQFSQLFFAPPPRLGWQKFGQLRVVINLADSSSFAFSCFLHMRSEEKTWPARRGKSVVFFRVKKRKIVRLQSLVGYNAYSFAFALP